MHKSARPAGDAFDERSAAGCLQEHGWERIGDSDIAAVAAQLGRSPRGVWAVCARCACGCPSVVANAPLQARMTTQPPGGKVLFPTLFWLTCRELTAEIGRLESSGGIQRAHAWLAASPEARAGLEHAHERAARIRTAWVPQTMRERLAREQPGPYEVLTQSGVAGIRGGGVKCLHAHVADHLAVGDNPVGEWALAVIGWSGCECTKSTSSEHADGGMRANICSCVGANY